MYCISTGSAYYHFVRYNLEDSQCRLTGTCRLTTPVHTQRVTMLTNSHETAFAFPLLVTAIKVASHLTKTIIPNVSFSNLHYLLSLIVGCSKDNHIKSATLQMVNNNFLFD
jgi:hypothetical protein